MHTKSNFYSLIFAALTVVALSTNFGRASDFTAYPTAPYKPTTPAQIQAYAATLHAHWLMTHHDISASAAPPTITFGNILTPAVNVNTTPLSPIPSAPRIRFKYTSPGGFNYVSFSFLSPSGKITRYATYEQGAGSVFGIQRPAGSVGADSGTLVIQNPGTFGLYDEAGIWTLISAVLGDDSGNFSYLDQSQLAQVFKTTSLQVINSNPTDYTPPTIGNGNISTPRVSASAADPTFMASAPAMDDVSGFQNASIFLLSPSGEMFASGQAVLSQPATSARLKFNVPLISSGQSGPPETGTWTIQSVFFYDLAGNMAYFSGPQITALFGKSTFEVTK